MIGADQEVRGFQWRAQKAFQFGAVVDSRDAVEAGDQHLFGAGIQIPAGQGMDAAFEQGKVLPVHTIVNQRQAPVWPPAYPPFAGIADHEAEVGGVRIVFGETHPVPPDQGIEQAVPGQRNGAALEHQALFFPV